MSVTPLRTTATQPTLGDLLGPRRRPRSRRTPTPATPSRRVPAPRYEALAIGLGCDHLGRHRADRHR